MVNINDVQNFCSDLHRLYYFNFSHRDSHRGVDIWGETVTPYGKRFSMLLEVSKDKIDVRIYDSNKNLLHSSSVKESISRNAKLKSKIKRIVTQQ